MQGATSLRFTSQAQTNLRRITNELSDLQGQIASGRKANDLAGLGGGSTPFLSASGLKASIENRLETISRLTSRLDVQSLALRKAADSTTDLAQEIRTAIASGDGRGIAEVLRLNFNGVVQAMNETWNGQPMFAGERQDVSPITVSTLQGLATAPSLASVFDEAAREQIVDLGDGIPIQISSKASTLSGDALTAMRDLQALLTAQGGQIGQPINSATQAELLAIASALETGSAVYVNEEARIGQLLERFDADAVKLAAKADLLSQEMDKYTGADLAEVSIRLNMLMAQYEASAKSFAELSKLSLLDYL